ncbi:hypothetical protein H1C71_012298, partial [Ictidomys tridecemlineatus]
PASPRPSPRVSSVPGFPLALGTCHMVLSWPSTGSWSRESHLRFGRASRRWGPWTDDEGEAAPERPSGGSCWLPGSGTGQEGATVGDQGSQAVAGLERQRRKWQEGEAG